MMNDDESLEFLGCLFSLSLSGLFVYNIIVCLFSGWMIVYVLYIVHTQGARLYEV